MSVETIIWIGVAAILGIAVGALAVGLGMRVLLQRERADVARASHEVEFARSSEQQVRNELRALQEKYELEQKQGQRWYTELETTRTGAEREQKHLEEKLELLQQSETRLQKEFENLANRIFEQKSAAFETRQTQTLSATLKPLKEHLDTFRKQVNEQFTEETKQRSSLQKEILTLKELNQQMASEAEALTRALKGDSRQQGAWGELVLERILEQSGLREGYEYDTQGQHRSDEGKRYKPDVIVHLPNQRDVIIDSKVSLAAYERYFNADDDVLREKALAEHVTSLRNHIRELGKKNYQQLEGVRTLDYVLLFVPVEPAFLLAVDRDPELIRLALDNQIMLVSPTNLLVALRTVHNIWQYEHQSQNAQQIAADAGKLYDKFVGFLEDLSKIGNSLDTTRKHYDSALNKLSTGRGNIVGRVEKFRQLGVNPGKRIDQAFLNDEDDDDTDTLPETPAKD
ncbi:DNA recombination protein RmuC [Aliidiomarina halalkaliphila]|uniref:DNA recombination protein RmuC n=1 Tax=Aliidiomarina halalkaliphila TaxID=2593535 RepID=A0A552X4T4_9GAMM|nr:DNA recombination protein RmuC [Aliidiomarina halalkaliphila]TRW50031.1 DNA recombination protein RmuC [Aliidiomarina halalkaliphila]